METGNRVRIFVGNGRKMLVSRDFIGNYMSMVHGPVDGVWLNLDERFGGHAEVPKRADGKECPQKREDIVTGGSVAFRWENDV
jgi:hypothetical protein